MTQLGKIYIAPGGMQLIVIKGGAGVLSDGETPLLRADSGEKFPEGTPAGTYALTGSAIAFHTTFHLPADHGVYLLTGQDVSMVGPPPVVTFYPGKYRAEWASALADVRAAGI